jgi:type I restriction enzyme S subunit
MSEPLPTAALGELVDLQTAKVFSQKDPQLPYVGLEHMAQGAPRLLATAESRDSISVNSLFKKHDILFGKLRPNLKKSLRAPFDGYCSTDILVLRCREGINPAFAGHVFQWDRVFAAAAATAAGTKMPRASWDELRRVRVFAPESEHEQLCIAMVLDLVDEAIAKTEAVIAKLRQVRTGVVHDLITRGLDENGELRDPVTHSEQFKWSRAGWIPRSWECPEFGTHVLSSAFGPRFSSEHYSRHGNVALLRTTDMDEEGNLLLDQMPLASLDAYQFADHFLQPGDLLISRSGTCGIAAVFPGYGAPVLPGAFLIRFRLDARLRPDFSRMYFNSPTGRQRLILLAEGGVQKNLRGSAILKFRIPVPEGTEQHRIVEKLGSTDERISAEEKVRLKLNNVKVGLAADVLTGRVRVPESVFAAEAQA